MASPEVLDFDQLLAPIPGDNPAGVDLREDFAPDSIYRQIRALRTVAREAERRIVYPDEDKQRVPRGDPPNWKPVLKLGPKAIAEQSKDLEIVAVLTEALLREHGYTGLRDGLRLARELVERFWDGLYPPPDEEGVTTRVSHLAGLNGEEGDGVLVAPIAEVPITAGGGDGAYSVLDYKQARELEAISDPEKRARRLEQGDVITRAEFDTAVSETATEWFRDLWDDIVACSEEYEKLCAVLEEKCGKDESGYSLAPPSSNIRSALRECRETVEKITRDLLGLPMEAEPSNDEAGALQPAQGGHIASQVQTREEAFRALLWAADFFKRTEPHSPVSYALEQAVRWGKMSLPDLLTELISDETAREQLFKLVGIKPPEEQQ